MAGSVKPRVPKSGESPIRTRRPRLSPDQTRQRVLHSAVRAAGAGGLTVGLDHLSFEEAIRDADVSRTAAYRCWPHKEAFLADLVVALAEQAIPAAPTRNVHGTTLVRTTVADHADQLATVEGRRQVLDRVVRVTAADDFDLDRAELARWRTYLALVMSLQTMTPGPLRDKVAAAVADADRRLVARVARNYRRIMEILGFTATVEDSTLAGIGIALMRGLVIGDLASPTAAADRSRLELPATAFAAVIAEYVEPCDSSPWDAMSVSAKLAELEVEDLFA